MVLVRIEKCPRNSLETSIKYDIRIRITEIKEPRII